MTTYNLTQVPLPLNSESSPNLTQLQSTSHHMIIRAQHGIYKPNPRYALLLERDDITNKLRSVKIALQHDG